MRLLLLFVLMLPAVVQAQYNYSFDTYIPPTTITITGYTGSGGAVNIPNWINGNLVVAIGDSAFIGNGSLTSVSIPNSVKSIGIEAFDDCYNMTSVTIPNSVTSFGDFAFLNCYGLTSVMIPNSVTNIGDNLFDSCNNLTAVYFQGNAPSFNSAVFNYDNFVTVYYLPETTGWGSTFGGRPTAIWVPYTCTTITARSI